MERDNFMSPEEAKDFGLIDEVVEQRAAPGADGEAVTASSPEPLAAG